MSLSLAFSEQGTPASPPSQPSQRASQRASAASRARRAAAGAADPKANNGHATPPMPHAAPAVSASEAVAIPPAASLVEPSLAPKGGSRPSRGRLSAAPPTASALPDHLSSPPSPSPSPPAARRPAAVPAAAAPAARSKPVPADDGSTSFFSLFTFAPSDGPPRELGGTFFTWVHYAPAADLLQVVLLQQTPLFRVYAFHGKLIDLRPVGLYMSGMKDKDYLEYVLGGLREQDTRDNYEYEFITADDEDLAVVAPAEDGATRVRAQLKLYKQMGGSTRVPVCIAHLRFEPVKLSSSPLSPPDRPRQDELQYRQSTSLLVSALVAWEHRLRARRNAHDATIARQAEESKVAEALEQLPPNGDLPAAGRALIHRMAGLLNEKKALVRRRREELALLEQEYAALRPARTSGRAKAAAEDVSSESSSSEDEAASLHSEDDIKPIGEKGEDEEKEEVKRATSLAAAPAIDDDGVRAMEIEDDDQPPAAAPVTAPSGVGASADFPFPDSIEPVSFGSSLGLPSPSFSPPQSSHSTRASRQSLPTAAAGPSVQSSLGDLNLSPPRVKALVRKRARPIAVAHLPSPLPSPSSFPSQPYHAPSLSQTLVAAAAPAGRQSNRDASQVIREIASNATSRKAPHPTPPSQGSNASSGKKQRTQGSMRTSRLLENME